MHIEYRRILFTSGKEKTKADMNLKYMKFGDGPKNMVILPGLSLRPVTDAPQGVIAAYNIFSEEFTVYLFDYREEPETDLKIEDMAKDVADALNELEVKDIYLYGVSLGGMVAQSLSVQYPDLVKKLVLCSTVSKVDETTTTVRWKEYAQKKDIISLIDVFMKDVYTKEFYEKGIDIMISMYKNLSDEDLKDLVIRLNAVKDFDIRAKLNEIRIPVLVLGSKADHVFSYEQMKETSDILGCESYFYEGYSHAVYDEAKDIKEKIFDFFLK